MNEFQKLLMPTEEEQYLTADPSLAPKPFAPMSPEELAMANAPVANPASTESVILNTMAPPVDNRVEEKTIDGLMGKYIGAPRQVNVPQVDLSKYDSSDKENGARQDQFNKSLINLQADYKAAQEDARSRQMKAEMFAAVGNNIGNIVGGAQAMNTKAAVSAPQMHKIAVADQMGRVDKNHKMNYEGLLKQYKDLQDGQLTPANRLNADIVNAQLKMQGTRGELNSENQYYLRGLRVGNASYKEQEDAEFSNKEKGEIDDITTSLAAIKSVHADSINYKDMLGPNTSKFEDAKTGMIGGLIRPFSPINKGYTEFRANAKALHGAYKKAITGLTSTTQEAEELNSYVPTVDMPYDAFIANAKAFEKRAEQLMKRKLESASSLQGKMTEGYRGKGSPSQAPAALSQKDQAALNWANANSSDPRAADILKKLGR